MQKTRSIRIRRRGVSADGDKMGTPGGRSKGIHIFTSAPKGMKKNNISFSVLMVHVRAVIQLLWKRQTCVTNSTWTHEQRYPHPPLLLM
jgi:hypothetical protein